MQLKNVAITKEDLQTWAKVAIKLGTASTLATFLVKFLNLGYAFPAAIVPVLVMGQTRGSTIQSSLIRIKGTLIGTVVGAIVYQFLGSSALALFLSVSGAVFISHWVNLPGVKGAAGYIAAITLTLNSNDRPWMLAASQFAALSIGIVITNLVDDLLWPARAQASLQRDTRQILLELRAFYQLTFTGYFNNAYQAAAAADCNSRIVALIRHLEPLWREAVAEQHQMLQMAANWDTVLHRIWDHVQSMDQIAQTGAANALAAAPELRQLAEATLLGFETLADTARLEAPADQTLALETCLLAATTRLDQLQALPVSSPAELRRFLSFFYHMQEVALSLGQINRRL